MLAIENKWGATTPTTAATKGGVVGKVGGAIGTAMPYINILTSIVPVDKVAKSVAAVLANMDLSCWGSATSISGEKKRIEAFGNYARTKLLSMNEGNMSEVLTDAHRIIRYNYRRHELSIARRSWASCTRKGWLSTIAAAKALESSLINASIADLRKAGYVVTNTTKSVPQQSLEDMYDTDSIPSNTTAEKNGNITYNVYKVVPSAALLAENALKNVKDGVDGVSTPEKMGIGFLGILLIGGFVAKKMGFFKFKS